MIQVDVRLYATLRKYGPQTTEGQSVIVEVPERTRLADLRAKLGLPQDQVKTIFVNNKKQNEGYQLKNGDRVAFFPAIAGG